MTRPERETAAWQDKPERRLRRLPASFWMPLSIMIAAALLCLLMVAGRV